MKVNELNSFIDYIKSIGFIKTSEYVYNRSHECLPTREIRIKAINGSGELAYIETKDYLIEHRCNGKKIEYDLSKLEISDNKLFVINEVIL